jgi:acetyltransferase-like isoleucine patch superfamily enzyme
MQNQLRQHLKYSFRHFIRYLYWKGKLGALGKKAFIESNVKFLRYGKNILIDSNVVLKEGTRVCACNSKATIKIGENTTIGYHNFIFASKEIRIGKNCLIAPFVYLVDSNHQIARNKLINQQPNEAASLIIGDDVWIASNTTILKGVTIGDGAVIGAHSLVNKDVEPYTIVAGSPAKKIGMRE